VKTSKNPKVLNNVLKNVLDPILARLELLKGKQAESEAIIESVESQADGNMEKARAALKSYYDYEALLDKTLNDDKALLTYMIRHNLYNPNNAEDPGEDDNTGGEEGVLPLFNGRSIIDIDFGYVKDGKSVYLAGITGRGLAYGEDTVVNDNVVYNNPSNLKFPSYYINDILKISNIYALIGTNSGLVEYDVTGEKYLVRTISNGLNTNLIKRIIPLGNVDGNKAGYLVGTDQGVCFSATGARWMDVDDKFRRSVTCFHSSEKLQENFKYVFIGTIRGVYLFKSAEYIQSGEGEVIFLEGIANILPSYYINAIAINTIKDILYIATDNGIVSINDISSYIASGNYSETPLSYKKYNSTNGLSSTLCFDAVVTPGQKLVVATANGLTVTPNFIDFSYITRKTKDPEIAGLESYMCRKIIRRNAASVTVLHPIGLTEEISV
jgi:hypothetical protein